MVNLRVDVVRSHTKLLSSVVSIPQGETGLVQIFHLSFKEFMTMDDSKWPHHRHDLNSSSQKSKDCVLNTVMDVLKSLEFNMAKLPTSHKFNRDIDINLGECIEEHLRYCALHWTQHLFYRHSGQEQMILQFLESAALFWIEVLALLGSVSRAVVMMADLRTWAKV
jgi:hypothetical protein